MTFDKLVQRQVYENAIDLLEIRPEHLEVLAQLPFHHKDPFDQSIDCRSKFGRVDADSYKRRRV